MESITKKKKVTKGRPGTNAGREIEGVTGGFGSAVDEDNA